MGILPLQYLAGESAQTLGLKGTETFEILGLKTLQVGQKLEVKITDENQATRTFSTSVRIDTPNELEYFKQGGILLYVLRQSLK
jgi:aconitate hydratase